MKFNFFKKSKPTFLLNRKCRNCGKPIADHEHAAREFCEVTRDRFGNVEDCKTRYHRILDYDERERLRNFNAKQRFIAAQLETLLSKKGNVVATADLNAYDVFLKDSMKVEISDNGTVTSVFLHHKIVSNPFKETHKIFTHDK